MARQRPPDIATLPARSLACIVCLPLMSWIDRVCRVASRGDETWQTSCRCPAPALSELALERAPWFPSFVDPGIYRWQPRTLANHIALHHPALGCLFRNEFTCGCTGALLGSRLVRENTVQQEHDRAFKLVNPESRGCCESERLSSRGPHTGALEKAVACVDISVS